MRKLKIYGDSILKGVMYSAEQRKYKLCEDNRFDSLSNIGVEVQNRAKMGATIKKGIELLGRNLDDIDSNTVVLLEFGGNDCDFDWKQISENPSGRFEANTPADKFTEIYADAVSLAKSKGAHVVISSLVPIDAKKYMRWITRGLNYDNILGWLGDVSMLYRWQEQYNRIVENICRRFSCELLDLRSMFLLSHKYDRLLCDDGIHPTQEGHDMINRRICEFMSKLTGHVNSHSHSALLA